jgi:hypothetical protein
MRRLISDVGLVAHPRLGGGRNILLQSGSPGLLVSLVVESWIDSLLQSRAILNYLVSQFHTVDWEWGLT